MVLSASCPSSLAFSSLLVAIHTFFLYFCIVTIYIITIRCITLYGGKFFWSRFLRVDFANSLYELTV